jgi:hypothetical protein
VIISTCFLFVLELVAVCAEIGTVQFGRSQGYRQGVALAKRLQAVCLVAAYFLYSPVTALIFQVFNCRLINGEYYLQKDYSLDCRLDEHRSVKAFAWVMMAAIAFGLPLLYLYVLYNHRKELSSGERPALEFFVRDYVPQWKYWEVAEIVKRLLLAGVAVYFTRGSLMQIAVSTVLVFTYLVLIVQLKPYRQHNAFAFIVNLALFFTLFAGIFVKLLHGWSTKGIYEEGFSLNFLAGCLILCAITVIGTFFFNISVAITGRVRLYQLEQQWVINLKAISTKLVAAPQQDPTGDAFYALKNPVDGSLQQKLAQLTALRDENDAILQMFFDGIDGKGGITTTCKLRNVRPGKIFIKINHKTDDSTEGKAVRPSLLREFSKYGLEHFKVVVSCVIDAFLFFDLLISNGGWKVVKFDIAKFVRPKEWGWRFVGADIQMANGQLVECYVVFTQMDDVKKHARHPDLSGVSNHEIYEAWRAKDSTKLASAERVAYETDMRTSRRIYDLAFTETLKRTTPELWEAIFHGWTSKNMAADSTADKRSFVREAKQEYLRLLGSDTAAGNDGAAAGGDEAWSEGAVIAGSNPMLEALSGVADEKDDGGSGGGARGSAPPASAAV